MSDLLFFWAAPKVDLKSEGDWVKLNAGQHTLMRVVYSPEMNKRLVQGIRERSLGPEVSGLGSRRIRPRLGLSRLRSLHPEKTC